MENIFIIAGVISVIFFIAKFLEMRFLNREYKPLKILVKDTLVVYFSVICGYFILEQVKPVTNIVGGMTPVFTDNPEF
jgi:uncharacterized membrane protein